MKVTKISIHDFKSIEDIELCPRTLTVFVGQNNCGKSNILEALRVYFNETKPADNMLREVPGYKAETLWIEVEYTGETPDELEQAELPEKYMLPGNRYRIRFTYTNGKGEYRGYIIEDGNEVPDSDNTYFGKAGRGKVGTVIYIPAIREVQAELKTANTAAFGKILKEIVSDEVKASPAYGDYATALSALETHIRGEAIDRPKEERTYDNLADIEATLNEELKDWNWKTRIPFTPVDPGKLVAGSANLVLFEHEDIDRDPGVVGQGLQRSVVNSLLAVWAEVSKAKDARKATGRDRKVFRPTARLLLYEEPEAYLALPQQRRAFHNLRTLAQAGTQVLMSTHSPVFLEDTVDDFSSLYVIPLADSTVPRTIGAALSARLDDEETQRRFRFHCWLNAERNAAFFADTIALVEGPTEKAIYLWLIQKNKETFGSHCFVVFDCGGKGSIPQFMELFGDFGLPHVVIHDDDHNKNDKHIQWNADIQTGRNTTTQNITPIPGDIEEYLEIPKSGDGRTKVVDAIWHIETVGIPKDKETFLLGALAPDTNK